MVENENQATYYIFYQPGQHLHVKMDGKKFLTGKWLKKKNQQSWMVVVYGI